MQTPIDQIKVGKRQRKELKNIEELAESMQRLGQLQPIIIDSEFNLIAGERRFRAAQLLKWAEVRTEFYASLEPARQQEVEFEENVKRLDLVWWERTEAIEGYHNLRRADDPDWSMAGTARCLGMNPSEISNALMVAAQLKIEPAIKAMGAFASAVNYCRRKMDRAIQSETDQFLNALDMDDADEGSESETTSESGRGGNSPSSVRQPGIDAAPVEQNPFRASPSRFQVLNMNFLEMAAATVGKKKANFLHCDFPYGVNMGTNALQGTRPDLKRYDDSEDVYFTLIKALLDNQDRICYYSCHIMFWFSMNFYSQTVELFEEAGWTVNPFPLIWHKSDGKGLLPDPQRGGRRTYETALLISRGDRKIVRPVALSISLPTNKSTATHLSEKPLPVLDHFFRMFVDESTELLDPTAGSGNAVTAALNAGAMSAIGLEIDPEFADAANVRIKKALLEPKREVAPSAPTPPEQVDLADIMKEIEV